MFCLTAFGQQQTQTFDSMNKQFEEFIVKKKFVEEGFYPGIAEEKLRPIFTEKINLAAKDFQKVAISPDPSNEKYLEAIKTGLSRFSEIYFELDTEDRERVCVYFEELMDIVGLESSNGQLNMFMYGFDPTKGN